MLSLFRPLASASASTSRRAVTVPLARMSFRQASSQTPTLQSEIIQPDARDSIARSTRSTPIPESLISAADLSKFQPTQDPDNWWTARPIGSLSSTLNKLPGNQFTGRSIPVKGGRGFTQAYRQLMGVLSRTGVRNDVRNSEYFEKPHVMRNRKKSERHRRRFQEMIRNKVQMVQAVRNRR